MQIQKLMVQNFRCFAEKEVTFSPHFNVLIGDNGSGKTAVLEALKVGILPFLDRLFPNEYKPYSYTKDNTGDMYSRWV
jgi:predicted ATP-binding protein involved in virulence